MTYIPSNPPGGLPPDGNNGSDWTYSIYPARPGDQINPTEQRLREIERKMDFLVAELTQEKVEKIIQNPPTSNELDEHPALRSAWNDLVRSRRERIRTKMLGAAEKYRGIRKLIFGEEKA